MASAIDDLITFARGLIPPGATESEEARRLDALAAAAREAVDGNSVAGLIIGKLCQIVIDADPRAKNYLVQTYQDTKSPRRLAVVIVNDNADERAVWVGAEIALRWVRHMEEGTNGER